MMSIWKRLWSMDIYQFPLLVLSTTVAVPDSQRTADTYTGCADSYTAVTKRYFGYRTCGKVARIRDKFGSKESDQRKG